MDNNLPRRLANVDSEGTRGDDPGLSLDIPNRNILHSECDGHIRAGTLLNHRPLEASKNLGRFTSARWESKIELRNFVTVVRTGVLNGEGNGERLAPEAGVATGRKGGTGEGGVVGGGRAEGRFDGEARVPEGCVRETVSELVTRLDVLGVEPAVVDIWKERIRKR